MSDREMTEAGDRIIALEFSEAGLAQEFHNKIKAILSPEIPISPSNGSEPVPS
jgi:hypothetical protein